MMNRTKASSTIFGMVLVSSSLINFIGVAQAIAQQPSVTQSQRQVPIEHYYWHFLLHQNELDQWAIAQAAKGHDGSALRNHLQATLALSDADYAPIRASSGRLAAVAKRLNAQAAEIRAGGPSPAATAKLNALTTEKNADITAEVSSLRKKLSPDKIAKLEAFMVRFFSPAAPPAQQSSSPTAVQH